MDVFIPGFFIGFQFIGRNAKYLINIRADKNILVLGLIVPTRDQKSLRVNAQALFCQFNQ